MQNENSQLRQHIINLTKNPRMNEFTGERIVERLTEKDLIKVQKIMKKHTSFPITTFLRIFREIMAPSEEEDFYLTYGLFRLFQEVCLQYRKSEITFPDISTLITQKMPTSGQDIRLPEKLYPLGLEIPDALKRKIFAPEVIGKVLEERERLEERPSMADKIQHLNRRVAQSLYSPLNDFFMTIDYPSTQIQFLSRKFQLARTLQTELQISKRDAIITWIAWSQHQQRVAAILGNYSISLWAKEDDFRYEVNVPLPAGRLSRPYIAIGYMESSKVWWGLDERPTIYILSHYNFQPQYEFTHFKMIREKATQRILTVQLQYRKLLCLAFERNVFLVSLQKRQIITQIRNFSTSITSIAFSESYQALFVSTFSTSFTSFELSSHLDLTERGVFEGHKGLVNLLGVLEGRPVVFSIDERSVIKLWDIRDFSCYQTFDVLRNVDFRYVMALPDSICLVGSKHVCYRWQRFSEYQEREKVVLITQLQKDILMVSSKEIRLYSHSNGVLIKVVKGVFGNNHIIRAHLVEVKKKLLLANQQGLLKVYSTQDFSYLISFPLPPKPYLFNYEKQTQLLTIYSLGEILICLMDESNELPVKRRITNQKETIRYGKVSTRHDLMAVQYQGPHLFFYSYQRAKPMGFLVLEDLISMQFLANKNGIIVLCKDKLFIFTFKKSLNSLCFFMKKVVNLWSSRDLDRYQIRQSFFPIFSAGFVLSGNSLVIPSNNSTIMCKLTLNLELISEQLPARQLESYNPFRVATEDHLEAFEMNKPSVMIDDSNQGLVEEQEYIRQKSYEPVEMVWEMGQFFCITTGEQTSFFDLSCASKGAINFKETLPLNWDLHNYTEQQFSEFEFVLAFIEQEQQSKKSQETLTLTEPVFKANREIITLDMLNPASQRTVRSTSLRQKKMVLEKEREERQKMENFLELRKGEDLAKLKQINRNSNEKYVSECLAFLNVNRNKLLLSKGIPQAELPQIRTLEAKLNAAINRDQKKSIVSKYSHPFQFASPSKKRQPTLLQERTPTPKHLKLTEQPQRPVKEQLRRLDLTLRQSKFQHKSRSSSLPLLRVRANDV